MGKNHKFCFLLVQDMVQDRSTKTQKPRYNRRFPQAIRYGSWHQKEQQIPNVNISKLQISIRGNDKKQQIGSAE